MGIDVIQEEYILTFTIGGVERCMVGSKENIEVSAQYLRSHCGVSNVSVEKIENNS